MAYSLGAIFASECIATLLAIYLGESIIANEVLAGTKGRNMGWGFVALGFGTYHIYPLKLKNPMHIASTRPNTTCDRHFTATLPSFSFQASPLALESSCLATSPPI